MTGANRKAHVPVAEDDPLFPAADRAMWPWPRHVPRDSRILLARIAWDVRENGDVEAPDAAAALRRRLEARGVDTVNRNTASAIRSAAKLGLITPERRPDSIRLGAIRTTTATLPPNPWALERPPVVEPAPALRSVPEPAPAPQAATEAPLELPASRWSGLTREQRLLAIMDLAGLTMIEDLTTPAAAPTDEALERLAEALADNARLRNDLEAERRRRRDAEGAAESGAKALRAERKRAQLIQSNLDALVAGIAKGPVPRTSEIARLMQQRPGG
jgi:hypothetical protein